MQLVIIAVGQRMPGWVDTAFEEYAKRMPGEMKIVLREVKPEPRSSSKTAATVMAIERERIEAACPKGSLLIALDERGRELSTMALSEQLDQWRHAGRDVALVIGGADGLDAGLKARADGLIRLSSLTLPHGMVRVMLAEALYRAWTVLAGHPYHRA